MKLNLRTLYLSLPLLGAMSLATMAHADALIDGSVYFNAFTGTTLPPTAPTGTPDATFTASSFNFDEQSGTQSVIAFLDSGSLTSGSFVCNGGGTACGSQTNLNDTYVFTGTTFLNANQTYEFTHDDGMYLYLDGTPYISSGGDTTAIASDFSVTTSGYYSFEVLYTNVEALPSVLTSDVTPTPEPSSLVLLGSGLLAAAGIARRKFRV